MFRSLLLGAAAVHVFVQPSQSAMLQPTRHGTLVMRHLPSRPVVRSFDVAVDLGEGSIVEGSLSALFTESELVTVRYPLPFSLEVEPRQGMMKVIQNGNGLLDGDVLRACTTLEFRYDTARRQVVCGSGFRGRRAASGPATDDRSDSWWQRLFRDANAELGGFGIKSNPDKVLFVADGKPYEVVSDALIANQVDRGVDSIVMLFERPKQAAQDARSAATAFVPRAARPRRGDRDDSDGDDDFLSLLDQAIER